MKDAAEGGEIEAEYAISRQMLHRYLPTEGGKPGSSLPSEGFLRAAARILSETSGRPVRWEWIATGEGEPVEVEDQLRRAEETAADRAIESMFEEAVDAITRGFGEGSTRLVGTSLRRANLAGLWRRLAPGRTGELFFDPGPVGEALAAPLRALGIDPESMTAEAFDDYLAAASLALKSAAPPPTPSKSIRTDEGENDATD